MVNTRAKIKKTQNILKTYFSHVSTTDSDHQATQSGALIGSNDDLLTEILLRLPVTSILRFKSVSKHWRWLLSHRRFTLPYDSLLICPGLFVRNIYIPFDVENQSTPFRSLDFYHDLNGIAIIQSCNGLLLCCSDRGKEHFRKYYVFNPTTKQFTILPSVLGGKEVRKTICFMGLAFHQIQCIHYKVVCIHGSRTSPNMSLFHIQIYSSNTRKWKISDNHIHGPYNTPFRNAVYWNEAIHWIPSNLNPSYFDLNKEQLQKMPLPSPLPARVASFGGYCRGDLPFYFGECRGHLHMVDTMSSETHLRLIVYEMLGDHAGWFVKYKVELDDLPTVYPEVINRYQPRSSPHYHHFEVIDVVRGEEEEEDAFMVLKISQKIIKYNVLDKSFELLFGHMSDAYHERIYHGRIGYSEVHRYIQSLTIF